MKINNQEVKAIEKDGKVKYTYFACTCKGEDRDYWEKALTEYLEGGDERSIISGMVMHLEHYFQTSITDIGADMWFGVSLENWRQSFYIQCDRVEHGVLAAIKILEETYEQEPWEKDD